MGIPSLLFGTVVVLTLLALLYRVRALKHLEYTRHFSRSIVYAGDRIEMVERIVNRKLLPLPWLRLESLIAQGLVFDSQTNLDIRSGELFQNHISLFSLRPYRQITRRHQVLCAKRGLYRLDSATMTTGDPLGLNVGSIRFALKAELLVYPCPAELEELPLPVRSWLGELPVRRWVAEDPFLTSGVRGYRPGDPLSAVNWKATARTGELQVHRKDYTADHRLMIVLNLDVSEGMWKSVTDPERMELGIRYAASIAAHAVRHGMEVGLMCNGRLQGGPVAPVHLAPRGGEAQLTELLELLAKLELETADTINGLLEQEAGRLESAAVEGVADYVLLTCYTSDQLLDRLERLTWQGARIEQLTIPEVREEESA
ncbi:DUF58 domain-containing protein [Paenibacillus filicis]|uniref:DUF58 domain-containing protein n=1 Tax=Paenibacillus filicis TaxID=669464 RepID=A0ABU9DK50_9BACL